jgi:hypothetical protein
MSFIDTGLDKSSSLSDNIFEDCLRSHADMRSQNMPPSRLGAPGGGNQSEAAVRQMQEHTRQLMQQQQAMMNRPAVMAQAYNGNYPASSGSSGGSANLPQGQFDQESALQNNPAQTVTIPASGKVSFLDMTLGDGTSIKIRAEGPPAATFGVMLFHKEGTSFGFKPSNPATFRAKNAPFAKGGDPSFYYGGLTAELDSFTGTFNPEAPNKPVGIIFGYKLKNPPSGQQGNSGAIHLNLVTEDPGILFNIKAGSSEAHASDDRTADRRLAEASVIRITIAKKPSVQVPPAAIAGPEDAGNAGVGGASEVDGLNSDLRNAAANALALFEPQQGTIIVSNAGEPARAESVDSQPVVPPANRKRRKPTT